jgi:SAM-dependent methyltransferase
MDRLATLRDLFGNPNVELEGNALQVGNLTYPVVNDVIILLPPEQYPPPLKRLLSASAPSEPQATVAGSATSFPSETQLLFGEEWAAFPQILPEREREFSQYFDLVDLESFRDHRVCDLGCGIGRWSLFLKDYCRELILVDFSEAIFIARQNLEGVSNALFFMADLQHLPFRADFADDIICLGVLHYLRTSALDEVRALKRFAPRLLFYIYYAFDNRPWYFSALHRLVTRLRRPLMGIESPGFRSGMTWLVSLLVYLPLVWLGKSLQPLGLAGAVPLYDGYHDRTVRQIRQDVYNRLFAPIEQRVTRREVLQLSDTFASVRISDQIPYWHFLCERWKSRER